MKYFFTIFKTIFLVSLVFTRISGSYINNAKIGNNSIIRANSFIGEKVEIGSNCLIQSGTNIGTEGFGYVKDEDGLNIKFPHIGGVIIGDNMEIGSNVCIDRGTLGNTIIEDNVKIDNLVHIAHNALIKENCIILPSSVIRGGSIIGKNSWLSPVSIIRDGVIIGNNVHIGLGSTIAKNLPQNSRWIGLPARRIVD